MGKRKRRPSKPITGDYDRRDRDGISKVTAFAKWCIWAVTAAIAVVFAGFTLKDLPYAEMAKANPANFQAIVLSVYVWCWAIGTNLDTDVQGAVYLVDPLGGRIRWASMIAVLGLAVVSLLLVIVRHNELYFALTLLAFTSIDLVTWFYLRLSFLPPIIDASRRKYESQHDYFGQIQLDAVVLLVIGNWKWWRHSALFAIVVLMVLVALFPRVQIFLSMEAHSAISAVAPETIRQLFQDFLLLLFLLVSEGWYFAMRLRTLLTIRLINEMESRFRLVPRV